MKTHRFKPTHVFLTALVCGAWYCVADEPQSTQRKTLDSVPIASSEEFVREAAWSGLQEVRLSEIALRKTEDSAVRDFAQMTRNDHKKANQELRQLALRKGIEFPALPELTTTNSRAPVDSTTTRDQADNNTPGRTSRARPNDSTPKKNVREQVAHAESPTATQQEKDLRRVLNTINRLESTSGVAFDRLYLRQMALDHQKAVRTFETAAQTLQDPELKQFVSRTLPKLREHKQQVEQLVEAKGVDNDKTQTPEPRP